MNKLFRYPFLSIAFLLAIQLVGQNNINWKDSTLDYLSNNGITGAQFSRPLFDSLIFQFQQEEDTCAEIDAKLYYSQYLHNLGDFESSLTMGMSIFRIFSPSCDSIFLVRNCITQAQNYNDIGDYTTALERVESGFTYYNLERGETKELASLYNAFGGAYYLLEEYGLAIENFRKSSHIYSHVGDLDMVQELLFNIGAVKFNIGELDSAEYYFKGSLRSAKKLSKHKTISLVYNAIAGISNNHETKIAYLDSALQLAIDNKLYADASIFHRNIALIQSENSDYADAYDNLWMMSDYKDSVYKLETISSLAEMKEKYESEKKALEISNLTLQKQDAELESALYKANQVKLVVASLTLILILIIITQRFFSIKKTKNILSEKNIIIKTEKERSEELLLNILPSNVAQELKDTGKTKAKSFDNVTILFTDFKNFTSVTAAMDPEELVEEINTCFKAFDDIVGKYSIEKIKTIGDAYLAAGGLHTSHVSNAADVVKAGLEIQRFMLERKEMLALEGKTCFDMRVGIHTGPVVAGIVGVKKFQYDIWGDTVNTASRMESNCEVGKINVSENTYNLVLRNATFNFQYRGEVSVKGKGEMKMWYVS